MNHESNNPFTPDELRRPEIWGKVIAGFQDEEGELAQQAEGDQAYWGLLQQRAVAALSVQVYPSEEADQKYKDAHAFVVAYELSKFGEQRT